MATWLNRLSSRTAPMRRTPAGSTRRIRSSRTSLSRPWRSQGPDPMSVQRRPARASFPRSRSVVLAGQRQGQQPMAVMPDNQHRAVLAPGVVLLERHPGPDDLPGVGDVAVSRVGLVADLGGPPEVTRVCRASRLFRRRLGCRRAVQATGAAERTGAAESPSHDACEP